MGHPTTGLSKFSGGNPVYVTQKGNLYIQYTEFRLLCMSGTCEEIDNKADFDLLFWPVKNMLGRWIFLSTGQLGW